MRVHQRAVAGVGQPVAALHDPLDRQPVRLREGVVALVVRRHRHEGAGAVLHEHVVGDVDGQLAAVDRVGHGAAQEDAGLRPGRVAALLAVLAHDPVDVRPRLLLVGSAGGESQDVGVLGREDEERRAEQRVGPRREDRVVDAELLAAERDLGALRAPDPVALHPLDVRGPVDRVQVGDEAVRVVGDAEEPLLELADLHERAGALAAAVDHLLVGQHGLLDRVPVDRGLLAVREAVLEQLEEDPLRPAVVARLVRAELARPVDRDAPLAELLLEGGDRLLGRLAGMLAGADRVVLGGQAERVVAHRVQHPASRAPMEVRDGVAHGVDLQVPDVRLAAGVRQHLEHVGLRPWVVGVVGDLPGVLVRPHLLPAGLDLGRVVAVVGHLGGEDTSAARPTSCGRSRPPAGPRRPGVTMASDRLGL